ncbi:MAG TPA: hypothetical protein VM029_05385 [Opitutaceae bacterium]|nr:hypothetical protein [Opitutaceae bacterium]
MKWLLLALAFSAAAFAANEPAPPATAARERVIGAVQPEIRLADGKVFKNAKVLDVSTAKSVATISDGNQIRIVALSQLPATLREQVVAEATRGDAPRYNVYRQEVRPPSPVETVSTPAPPLTPVGTPTSIDRLIAQATAEAPEELKFYLRKSQPQLASITTQIRKAEQVPGWQKIRVSGDASVATWDNYRRDYVWRTEKFEVEFAILSGVSLKVDNFSFAGISRAADVD